jgi:hypothetical protein
VGNVAEPLAIFIIITEQVFEFAVRLSIGLLTMNDKI